jgi:hypothetical protein
VEIVRDDRIRERPDEYSRRRRQYVELYEIALMQFTASEVGNNIDVVLTKITEVAKRRSGNLRTMPYRPQPLQIVPRDQVVLPLG